MIFLDKPFVSEFLKETIRENAFPVVRTEITKEFGFNGERYLLDEQSAVKKVRSSDNFAIYTTSENAIGWIAKHLPFTNLPEKIELFKNKIKFRTLLKPMYPDFYFREVHMQALESLAIEDIPVPFIIKPGVGFFSMGVYKVSDAAEWQQTINAIKLEMLSVKDLYPAEVLNTTSFIIEQNIEGEEFAVDAYFNANGNPVILNIFKHIFSSDNDVSDRIYISSKEIIEGNIDRFSALLKEIGTIAQVKNFPVHVEVRCNDNGEIVPIEINPMRFGGWCTTADMAYYAYGFNPYEYYFSQRQPDWANLLKDKAGKLYSIIVLDNSTGVDGSQITAFDYARLQANFEKPLELRKIDFKEYPVFGFLFTETNKENFSELEKILDSDLKEFITVRN